MDGEGFSIFEDEDSLALYLQDEAGNVYCILSKEQYKCVLYQFFMSLAAGPNGKLYAMENSVVLSDDYSTGTVYSNATLYTIDPIAKTVERIGDTGIQCNLSASMAYDYDTGYLYWTPCSCAAKSADHSYQDKPYCGQQR